MASVAIDGKLFSSIGPGMLVLLGVAEGDSETAADWLVSKISSIRIFPDNDGKMNLDITNSGGEFLVVSQFTLHALTAKGNRPSFIRAAHPSVSNPLYEYFIHKLRASGAKVSTGVFGAMMDITLVNEGPVTIMIDSESRE